jgi:hypothetical protein
MATMKQRLREILGRGYACDAQLCSNLFDREAIEPVQQKRRCQSWWQLVQCTLEILHPHRDFRTLERIVGRAHLQFRKDFSDIDRLGCIGFTQRVLVGDMACDREEVCFGAANDFVLLDPHQTQKDLLSEVGHISRISGAGEQEPPQAIAILSGKTCHERLTALLRQF